MEKELFEELRSKVSALKDLRDEEKIVSQLQQILKYFLCNFYIVLNSEGDEEYKIYPTLVEIYYSHDKNEKQLFYDENVHAVANKKGKITEHAKKRQKENFGKLYIHNVKSKDDGMDICLSLENYYLSILIKNAKINNMLNKQSGVSYSICKECKKIKDCEEETKCKYYEKIVIKERDIPLTDTVVFLPRKGLSKEPHKDKRLAACCVIEGNIDVDSLAMGTVNNNNYSRRKQWLKSLLCIDKGKNKLNADEENGSKISDVYWKLAKEDYDISKKISEK